MATQFQAATTKVLTALGCQFLPNTQHKCGGVEIFKGADLKDKVIAVESDGSLAVYGDMAKCEAAHKSE